MPKPKKPKNEKKATATTTSLFPSEFFEPVNLAWIGGLFQGEATFGSDKRVRSKSKDPDYTPPPPIPYVRLEMTDQETVTRASFLLNQKIKRQNRPTTAGNTVYRTTIQARAKTEVFLRAIEPYVIGSDKRSSLYELLALCDEYNKWVADGGKTKAAQLAARAKHSKDKKQNSD